MDNLAPITATLGVPSKDYVDVHPWTFASGVKNMPSGTDMATVTATGFYDAAWLNASVPDPAIGGWWYLEVNRHSLNANAIHQRATAMTTGTGIITYERRMVGGVWQAWEKLATKTYVDSSLEVYVGTTQPSDVKVLLWVQTP